MATQIARLHGSLSPANIISDVLAITQTGSLHAYVADLSNDQLYVSFYACDACNQTKKDAYDRQWARIDLTALFAVTPQSEAVGEVEQQ